MDATHLAALVTLALGSLTPASTARAEAPGDGARELDPRNFDAATSPAALIGLDTTWVVPHLAGYGGLTLMLANDELVVPQRDRVPTGPLRERLVSTLGVGLGLFGALELRLALPLHLTDPTRAALPDGGGEVEAGLGDLRLGLHWRAFGGERGLGLALQLGLGLPTGGDAAFSSDSGLVLDPRLVVDWRSPSGALLAGTLGYRARPGGTVLDLAIGDELRYGAGLELPMGALGAHLPLSLVGELEGAVGLGTAAVDPDGAASPRKLPLELRLGLRWRPADWTVTLAGGTGLSSGYGTPDYRVVLGLAWSTTPVPVPVPDRDPVHDRVPVHDRDPVHGPVPDPAPTLAAFDDAAARDPDPDGDRVPREHDQCPSETEDADGHLDQDGCPDPDDDGDGVPDATDRCPDALETPNGIQDDDGCPDEGQGSVVARAGAIELGQTIEFRSGSDVLAPSAAPILAQLATVLRANPQVRRVRIEGHTDDAGHPEQNVDLSERRAARVRSELVGLGVDAGRLVPRGYGATRPVAPNTNAAGRQKNRRVELRVIDPPPASGETPPTVTPLDAPPATPGGGRP